jgi:methyl-accepting chemotaxis protein
MKPSILRKMFAGYMLFGISMGLVFPVFASFFVTPKEGMSFWFTISCLLAGIVMGACTYGLMKLILINKIQKIADVAYQIRNKDLTHSCDIDSNDVIGEIVTSFNDMNSELRKIISDLHEHTVQIEKSVTQVASVSADTAQGADIQFHAVYKIKQDIQTFMELIQSVSDRAKESLKLTGSTRGNVSEGDKITNQTLQVINQLSEHFNEASQSIVKLRNDIESISEILEVIDSISEQTNLLALNAAIEAARAGEQGRGFAVVADEVRQLAQRTHEATSMTKEKITSLQQEANSSVQMMERSNEEASLGVKTVGEIKQNFESILQNMQQMENESQSIFQVSAEQLDTAREIAGNIESVSALAEASQTGSQGSASESEKLKTLTRELEALFGEFILDKNQVRREKNKQTDSIVTKSNDTVELF